MSTHSTTTSLIDHITIAVVWLVQFLVVSVEWFANMSFDDVTSKILRILQIVAVVFSIWASYRIAKKNKSDAKKE